MGEADKVIASVRAAMAKKEKEMEKKRSTSFSAMRELGQLRRENKALKEEKARLETKACELDKKLEAVEEEKQRAVDKAVAELKTKADILEMRLEALGINLGQL